MTRPPPQTPKAVPSPSRRTIIKGIAGATVWAWGGRAPAKISAGQDRPRIPDGACSGDRSNRGVIIWSRTDRPARMWVEWSGHSDFRDARKVCGPDVLSSSGFCGKTALRELPHEGLVYYRVYFESLKTGAFSQQSLGQLTATDLSLRTPLTFAWSGDVGGQGFGINPDMGGMTIFETIREANPDVFIHCGDVVYADSVFKTKKKLSDGRIWRNLVTPAKAKVAETIEEFRGQYRYNALDQNLRKMSAALPQIVLWDDHETKNNWWPGHQLVADRRYRVKSCNLLSARARQAFFEHVPIARRNETPGRIYRKLSQGPLLDIFVTDARSYRGPNSKGRQRQQGPRTHFFGPPQLQWLCKSLRESSATWKVIACSQPLSLIISHGAQAYDGWANGASGPPRGRELEVAHLLNFLQREKVRNVVWLSADVHFSAAYYYDPKEGHFREFDPFWEFVAGPLNAATFGPNRMDPTFGPRRAFCSVPADFVPRRSPLDGFQFFGMGQIDPVSRGLSMSFHNTAGQKLWTRTLEPKT